MSDDVITQCSQRVSSYLVNEIFYNCSMFLDCPPSKIVIKNIEMIDQVITPDNHYNSEYLIDFSHKDNLTANYQTSFWFISEYS